MKIVRKVYKLIKTNRTIIMTDEEEQQNLQ